ncbi:unnamed protein product [Chrysoparadoxa australica]
MIKKFFKYFANLNFAIFLLLFIAFNSGIGSIIEQDKTIEFYEKNYSTLVFNIPLSKLFLTLGLDHIYTTWWFCLLLIIFGLCLISCTFLQQFPSLKFARRLYFYTKDRQLNKLALTFTKYKDSSSQISYNLIQNQYSLFQQYNSWYSYKGLIGRIGPVIVHLSIICILIGSMLSATGGFNSQEFVPKTEIFHPQNIIKTGNFANIPQYAIRINDFWSTYNKDGRTKQFQTDLSILLGNGKEITRKTISVNKPLIFKGVTYYQTDWGILGLRIQFQSQIPKTIQLPMSRVVNSNQKTWLTWLPLNSSNNKGLIIIVNNDRGQVNVYDENANFLNKINIGESIKLKNLPRINFAELISSTGIQIKTDPGTFTIYLGFGFLIISTLMSYISFSEIWFFKTNKGISVGGKTNRAKLKFQLEFENLKNIL